VSETPRRPGLMTADRRDDDSESSLRPLSLDDFTGQAAARANLQVFIDAAKCRGDALDHVLFVGPPGLGKTTLAQIMARELGVNFRSTSGPVIAKAGDLAAQLTNLEERDVLFIDEIHRLSPAVEEILYPAMEDLSARSDHRRGAGGALGQDRPAQIHPGRRHHPARPADDAAARPLRHPVRLQFYTVEELQEQIVARGARVLGVPMSDDGANEIAGAPAERRASPAACSARARFRHRRRRRPSSRARIADKALICSMSMRSASTSSTGATSPWSRSISAAARSGSRRSPPRCRSRAMRSRRSSSPS
jgi:Holliday junction DNA helicase RuvB